MMIWNTKPETFEAQLKEMLADEQKGADAWADRFKQDPATALRWYEKGLQAAARIEVLKGMLSVIDGTPVPDLAGLLREHAARLTRDALNQTGAVEGMVARAVAMEWNETVCVLNERALLEFGAWWSAQA